MSLMQGKRLLCATDLSHPHLTTERSALQLAKVWGSSLTFIHVLEDAPLFLGPMPFEEGQKWEQLETRYRGELLAQTHAKAESALSSLRSEGEYFDVVVKLGNAENEILGLLEKEGNHFGGVIIGRHHHARIYSALFGSVAQRISEQSPVPVVILPVSEKALPTKFENIGIATALRPDTQTSEVLLRELLSADPNRKTTAHLAHCFERVSPGFSGFETTDAYATYRELEMIYDMAETRLERAVQERARLLMEDGFSAVAHLLIGQADEELLNFVTDNKIELMLFGRHAQTGAHRFHLGRMVMRFIKKAPCIVVMA